jgi:hypothetical protein
LRLKIVETLTEEARTVMQVARLLDRKPTGLYHHMRVLEAAGLVRQTSTQQKRGTVERYFRAVHPDLRIDPSVFAGRRSAGARRDVLIGVLETADLDVRRLGKTAQPMIALRLDVDLDAARLADLESVVRAWTASMPDKLRTPYRVTLVAYPRGGTAAAVRHPGSAPRRRAARTAHRRSPAQPSTGTS